MNATISIFLNRGKDSEGQEVIRPYTPITLDSDVGYFELVVKVLLMSKLCNFHENLPGFSLFKSSFIRFSCPQNCQQQMYPKGKMSHHFRELREGENLAVKGPKVYLST